MKFPNESKAYRVARNKLPAGGGVPEDYLFEEEGRKTRLSELFVNGDALDGSQWPMLNVFVRRRGALDLTPQGRGKDWYPKLDYRS